MVEYIVIELDILRDGDTAMYPVTAENPFDAVNKFYMMRKLPASDHIMVIPKANIFEHCRNMIHTRRLHWRTEIDGEHIPGTCCQCGRLWTHGLYCEDCFKKFPVKSGCIL